MTTLILPPIATHILQQWPGTQPTLKETLAVTDTYPELPNFNSAPLAEHNPRLIGLSGYARSGKDTVAEILGSLYGYERRAFADRLKGFVYQVNPMLHVETRVQDIVNSKDWEHAKTYNEGRRLLIEIGNKAREFFGEDVWVNALFSTMSVDQHYVISDVRYPNEAERIKSMGGVVLRVTRPGVGPVADHISETGLDDYPFDAVIENDGSLLDLQGSVMIALGDLG